MSSASAKVVHPFLFSFNGASTPAGSFNPQALAVDNSGGASAGDVYVGDGAGNVVDKFSLSGSGASYVCQITGHGSTTGTTVSASECDSATTGTPTGKFSLMEDTAVDPGNGTLYVSELLGKAVDAFSPGGAYQSQIVPGSFPNRVAVQASTGDVFIAEAAAHLVVKFDPATGAVTTFATGTPVGTFKNPTGVAIDNDPSSPSYGDVYVADFNVDAVDVFSSTGTYLRSLTGTPAGAFSDPTTVAVDPANGHVYVVDTTGRGSTGSVDEFDASGVFLGSIAAADARVGSWSPVSVAISATTGDVLVGDSTNKVVDVFGADTTLPDATTDPASNVTPTDATLNGTVNPDGVALTGCHFDYGTDTSYSAGSVPCLDSTGNSVVGNASTTGVQVHADVSGLTAGQTYHFRLVAANANGPTDSADQLFGPPVANSEFADGLERTGATLHATVNPQNVDTSYHFEYGTSTSYGHSIPIPDVDIGAGGSDVQVSQTVAGLTPNTTYHFRVVVTSSAGSTDGPDETFTTTPPAILDIQPPTGMATSTGLGNGDATLNVYVNPQGADTSYHFDYGTSTSYGSSTPTADAGAGGAAVLESAQVSGLAPGTTYHYRTVVSNSFGSYEGPDSTFTTPSATCPNQQFRTGLSAGLPDCRAYEQVSPEDKGGYSAALESVAPSGDRVSFLSPGKFAGAPSGLLFSAYVADRGAQGWTSAGVDAPPSLGQYPSGSAVPWLAPDLSRAASQLEFGPNEGTAALAAPTGAVFDRQSDGSFSQASPVLQFTDGTPLGAPPQASGFFCGASSDFSTLLLCPQHPLLPSDTTPPGDWRVYEVTGANTASPGLRLVSVDASGSPLVDCANALSVGTRFSAGGEAGLIGIDNPVSQDGSTVFMATWPAGVAGGCSGETSTGTEVLARVGGQTTVDLSDPAVNDACTTSACRSAPRSGASFWGASADGSKAFFLSTQQLTDQASEDPNSADSATSGDLNACPNLPQGPNGCNLYMYDFNRPAGHELVALSAGDSSGLGPQVRGVLRVSNDGSHVYFVAGGILTSQPNQLGQVARAGADNLYVADTNSGTVNFIAELCSGSGRSGAVTGVVQCPGSGNDGPNLWHAGGNQFSDADLTPDGRYLVFPSYAQLTPDDTNSAQDVYEYDAQTGGLWRVSVGHDGADQNGNGGGQDAVSQQQVPFQNQPEYLDYGHDVSADGQTVVFTTARPLQSSAVNGLSNVYEWHQGEVSLISGGQATRDANGVAVTPSGNDIIFDTDQGLLPQDTDGQYDVYDARVGGGFPAPPVPPAACSGDTCQGSPSAALALPTAASVAFSGPGNATSGSRPAKAKVLTRTVRAATFMVRVRAPQRGRISITGAGIRAVGRSVSRAGTYALRVTLTKAAKQTLGRRRELRLRLRVAYAPAAGAASSTDMMLTVRPALGHRGTRRAREATAANRGGAR